jgi:hypothetical protein
MPWRECNVMDERVKSLARLLEGEKVHYRNLGYKIIAKVNRLCRRQNGE